MEVLATRYKKTIYISLGVVLPLFLLCIFIPVWDTIAIVSTVIFGIATLFALYFALQPKTAIYLKDGKFYLKTLFKTTELKGLKYVSIVERKSDYYGRWNLIVHLHAVNDVRAINVVLDDDGTDKYLRVSLIENSNAVVCSINALLEKTK